MIDIKNKKYEYNDCLKQAYYNFENQNKALYCSKHKQKGMINVLIKKCE